MYEITKIPERVLRGEADVGEFAVAARMSWASRRETTRTEDLAYCLLGIFDVNMPLNYGEGEKAFTRLQMAILQTVAEMSIFLWTDDRTPCPPYAGMLAESPRQFASCHDIENTLGDAASCNFTIATSGIQTNIIQVINLRRNERAWGVAMETLCHMEGTLVGVGVRKIGAGLFLRIHPDRLIGLGSLGASMDQVKRLGYSRPPMEPVTLATRLLPRYPFHPSGDPVRGNRWSALQVNWGPIKPMTHSSQPLSHWDPDDEVFFTHLPHAEGWCSFIVRGSLVFDPVEQPLSTQPPSTFLVACFRWNYGVPTVVVARLDDVNPAMRALFELQLEQLQFDQCLMAELLTMGILDNQLQEEWIESAPRPVKYWTNTPVRSGRTTQLSIKLSTRQNTPLCGTSVFTIHIVPKHSSLESTFRTGGEHKHNRASVIPGGLGTTSAPILAVRRR